MKTRLALAAGAAAFLIVATANSGGYRYGISDQAFYIPAIAHAADPALFPRDTAVFAPQMKLWAGDDVLGFVLRVLPVGLPGLFAVLYLAGLLLLFAATIFLARGLGASWFAVAGATAFLTLRHRIAKTGANSLEGYMHPRMIAFAIGLIALGFMLRRRWTAAVISVVIAATVHPSTALWFSGVVALGLLSIVKRPSPKALALIRILFVAVVGYLVVSFYVSGPTMDSIWVTVLGEKDYLFPDQWPAYAWALNLLYPAVIVFIFQRRESRGITVAGEDRMVAGLLVLVVMFLVSVPLAAAHKIPVVQMQVNRVFWLLDAVALIYVAWWLLDDVAKSAAVRKAITVAIVALACGRAIYILVDTGRAFATFDLPRDDWTDVMRWIRTQPVDWQVLADPAHASKYGTSVRVAALRDTVIERSKDSAMAMYDAEIAYRVFDRSTALSGFETFSGDQFRKLGGDYDARILVLERTRALDLPRLYENGRFVIYDLR